MPHTIYHIFLKKYKIKKTTDDKNNTNTKTPTPPTPMLYVAMCRCRPSPSGHDSRYRHSPLYY